MNEKKFLYSREADDVLIERMRDLQQATERSTAARITLIYFRSGGKKFALDSRSVVQVVDTIDYSMKNSAYLTPARARQKDSKAQSTIIPIPLAPSFIRGIANIRGALHTVVDLSQLIFDEPSAQSDASQLIHIRENSIDLCILTDEKAETLVLFQNEIQATVEALPQHLHGILAGAVPVGDDFIGLLDPIQFVQHTRLAALLFNSPQS